MMPSKQDALKSLLGVSTLLNTESIKEVIRKYGPELATYALRRTIEKARLAVLRGAEVPPRATLEAEAVALAESVAGSSLREVINATGIVLHTNLGRAPLGAQVFEDLKPIILGYSNLEFDLESASRGSRHDHLSPLLRFITGAEDAIAVNNNTAALILTLGTLAPGREVIISRGELIEIGGSFRLPEIMAASGAIMVEVGTTNKTRLSDYERAINDRTALILKAHRSNFALSGFTESPTVKELAMLARERGIPFVYDLGSGLLRKPASFASLSEPDVRSSLAEGADLVLFSCDKLLGGPQAGIVSGRADLVARLKKAPIMRALRVCKITIAALVSVMRSYLSDESLLRDNPVFSMLSQTPESLRRKAQKLARALRREGLACEVLPSPAQCGGGTLPDLVIDSSAVRIVFEEDTTVRRSKMAELAFAALLALPRPILGLLRSAELHLDVLTLAEADFPYIASALALIVGGGPPP